MAAPVGGSNTAGPSAGGGGSSAAGPTTGNQSLVKYDNPVQLSKNDEARLRAQGRAASLAAAAAEGGPSGDHSRHQQTEDILNAILPPRSFTEEGQTWVEKVSSTPATRLDVINLQQQLDLRLEQRKARKTGIDPVRRELYDQCFDELIRQVTINTAERGLLILRVRDEIRMTMHAYQMLYESSVAFGMRKALQAEQGKAEMRERIAQLEDEKRALEREVEQLEGRADAIEKREAERRLVEGKNHAEEVNFLKRMNAQLKSQIETILEPVKK